MRAYSFLLVRLGCGKNYIRNPINILYAIMEIITLTISVFDSRSFLNVPVLNNHQYRYFFNEWSMYVCFVLLLGIVCIEY